MHKRTPSKLLNLNRADRKFVMLLTIEMETKTKANHLLTDTQPLSV